MNAAKKSIKHKIKNKFEELFDSTPIFVRSPGRLNIIGEHTDYNNGFVLPAAINKEITFAIAPNSINKVRLFALDLGEYIEQDINELNNSDLGWPNYLLGVIDILQKDNFIITGVDCVFGGDIPIGAGLSSSAALENGFVFGLSEIFNLKLTKEKMIHISQKSEHVWAGVMCGIMDQFASMYGEKNQAMLLDCKDLSYDYVNFNFKGFKIVLIDSKVKHNLASSEYNIRRQECEMGVETINKDYPNVNSLRDIKLKDLDKYKDEFTDIIYSRCSFVIEENERVLMAKQALSNGDIGRFGELIYASHDGLRRKYEVSCKELDLLVDTTKELDYVIGSRMMGGGFGGCTINFIEDEKVDEFCDEISLKYKLKTGIDCAIYEVNISNGTSLL